MRPLYAALICIALIVAFVATVARTSFMDSRIGRARQDMDWSREAKRLKALGVANPTWRDETTIMGTYPLISSIVVGEAPNVRRISFRDVRTGERFEALIDCASPRIYNGLVAIYRKQNIRNGRITFFVQCDMESPASPAPAK